MGGSGYTGIELLRILLNHPSAVVTVITSRKYAGQEVSRVFPSVTGVTDLVFSEPDLEQMAEAASVIFTCVPHQTAMNVVPFFLEKGLKVIDLSADFRIRDKEVYEE
ncbi:MAG: N-acetyl-gamma-glutamyl-phosphate reductase, partial [Thermodesulfatator sp.]